MMTPAIISPRTAGNFHLLKQIPPSHAAKRITLSWKTNRLVWLTRFVSEPVSAAQRGLQKTPKVKKRNKNSRERFFIVKIIWIKLRSCFPQVFPAA